MQHIQLELPEKFQSDINFIKAELQDLKKNFIQKDSIIYITRRQLADKIHSDISTVHNLSVKGVFKKHQVGGKVLYRLDQVESAIVELKR